MNSGPEKDEQGKPGELLFFAPVQAFMLLFLYCGLCNCLAYCMISFFLCFTDNSLVKITDGNKYKGSIYMVFEYMDHDLTGLADRPGMRFAVPQIKVIEVPMAFRWSMFPFSWFFTSPFLTMLFQCYMKQLLTGLHYCHVNQVLHRDIKGCHWSWMQ